MQGLDQNSNFALVLLPDPEEIEAIDDADFVYSGGYSKYEKELKVLLDDIMRAWFADEDPKKADEISLALPPVRREAGFFPEFIFELGASLSAGAVGAGLFNLLGLWVKRSNGRKLRVRLPSGMEVEATQMKHEEFRKLIAQLHGLYGQPETRRELRLTQDIAQVEQLLDEAFKPGYLLSKSEAEAEKQRLKDLYIQNRRRITEGLRKPNED